jgi:hypothetical protein
MEFDVAFADYAQEKSLREYPSRWMHEMSRGVANCLHFHLRKHFGWKEAPLHKLKRQSLLLQEDTHPTERFLWRSLQKW